MNEDETHLFDCMLEKLRLSDPEPMMKEKIMKAVYLLSVAKEVGAFHASIPLTLLNDSNPE
ncbi:MAG: hypothetical protein KC643_04785 [Nitrospira sp.]|nr:hypothetical protein [Nitrospira sp.]